MMRKRMASGWKEWRFGSRRQSKMRSRTEEGDERGADISRPENMVRIRTLSMKLFCKTLSRQPSFVAGTLDGLPDAEVKFAQHHHWDDQPGGRGQGVAAVRVAVSPGGERVGVEDHERSSASRVANSRAMSWSMRWVSAVRSASAPKPRIHGGSRSFPRSAAGGARRLSNDRVTNSFRLCPSRAAVALTRRKRSSGMSRVVFTLATFAYYWQFSRKITGVGLPFSSARRGVWKKVRGRPSPLPQHARAEDD